jgi:hypothetical protein
MGMRASGSGREAFADQKALPADSPRMTGRLHIDEVKGPSGRCVISRPAGGGHRCAAGHRVSLASRPRRRHGGRLFRKRRSHAHPRAHQRYATGYSAPRPWLSLSGATGACLGEPATGELGLDRSTRCRAPRKGPLLGCDERAWNGFSGWDASRGDYGGVPSGSAIARAQDA